MFFLDFTLFLNNPYFLVGITKLAIDEEKEMLFFNIFNQIKAVRLGDSSEPSQQQFHFFKDYTKILDFDFDHRNRLIYAGLDDHLYLRTNNKWEDIAFYSKLKVHSKTESGAFFRLTPNRKRLFYCEEKGLLSCVDLTVVDTFHPKKGKLEDEIRHLVKDRKSLNILYSDCYRNRGNKD